MDLVVLKQLLEQEEILPPLKRSLLSFVTNYNIATLQYPHDLTPIIIEYIRLIKEQILSPYSFSHFHPAERSPFDFYAFSLSLVQPLLNIPLSTITGKNHLSSIARALRQKDNVILLANHQTEIDPQILSLLLTPEYPELASSLIYVAGHRVTQDPIAVPFSRGTNLLCIYSKKYIDTPPEEKAAKLQHNSKTMSQLQELLDQGGVCIFVAPSGGRDRFDTSGCPQIADFDPQSVEMFHLLAKKAQRNTALHLLALSTIPLLPPPKTTQVELGEERFVSYSPAHIAFGPALEMDAIGSSLDKHERRKERSTWMTQEIKTMYAAFQ